MNTGFQAFLATQDTSMKIAVFTKNRVNPAYGAARLGAERAAARLGAQVTHYVPELPDDAAEQSALNLGALATECAIRRARGEAVPAEILLPVEIIERGNVGAWDLPYERRPCLAWAEALRIGVKL